MQPLSHRPMTTVSTFRSSQSLQYSKHCMRHSIVLSFLTLSVLKRHILSIINSMIHKDFMIRGQLVLNNLTRYVTFTHIPHYPNTTIEVHRMSDRYLTITEQQFQKFLGCYTLSEKKFQNTNQDLSGSIGVSNPFFKHLWHFGVIFFLKQKIFF